MKLLTQQRGLTNPYPKVGGGLGRGRPAFALCSTMTDMKRVIWVKVQMITEATVPVVIEDNKDAIQTLSDRSPEDRLPQGSKRVFWKYTELKEVSS